MPIWRVLDHIIADVSGVKKMKNYPSTTSSFRGEPVSIVSKSQKRGRGVKRRTGIPTQSRRPARTFNSQASSLKPSSSPRCLSNHPQFPRRMSRSLTPTLQSPSRSATQSAHSAHGPQLPRRMSRSFTPTVPSPSKSPVTLNETTSTPSGIGSATTAVLVASERPYRKARS